MDTTKGDTSSVDGGGLSRIIGKSMDKNTYATKKTISQGILNIALLSANAAQLKYVLDMGDGYQFYIFLLCLLSISIVLQVVQAILCIILGAYNINDTNAQGNADKTNNIVLCINVMIVAINVVIGSFNIKD